LNVALAALSTCLVACASYEPAPIDPGASAATFRARSLSDAHLRGFVERHLPAKPAGWPPDVHDLQALTLVAFHGHPDLALARARARAPQAEIATARAWPNPRLGVEHGFLSNADAGVTPWLLGFNLEVPIEAPGKRAARVERAGRLSEAAGWRLAAAAWSVRSRLRVALSEHLFALRELELLRVEEAVRFGVAEALEPRLGVGEASRGEFETAREGLADARRALRAGEGRAVETRAAVAAAAGLPPSALEGASVAWADLENPPPAEAIGEGAAGEGALVNRLDFCQGLAEYGAAEAGLRLEVARQFPDVDLGPGYELDAGEHDYLIRLSTLLPIFRRNERPLAEARARREEEAARFLPLQAGVLAEVGGTAARDRARRAALEEAGGIVEAASARERAALRALEAGEGDRLEVARAGLATIAARSARLEAARRGQAALGALEDAVQRPLFFLTPLPNPAVAEDREDTPGDSR
jgi:outer membrane protein, heavy metal efflux system